jgi:hypothetical protein
MQILFKNQMNKNQEWNECIYSKHVEIYKNLLNKKD